MTLVVTHIVTYHRSQWVNLLHHHKVVMRQINSLGPSDTMWHWRSWSTLVQVMACCLTAPSHYLNQCWLIISTVLWHSSEDIMIRRFEVKITFFKITLRSPSGQWVNGTNQLTLTNKVTASNHFTDEFYIKFKTSTKYHVLSTTCWPNKCCKIKCKYLHNRIAMNELTKKYIFPFNTNKELEKLESHINYHEDKQWSEQLTWLVHTMSLLKLCNVSCVYLSSVQGMV